MEGRGLALVVLVVGFLDVVLVILDWRGVCPGRRLTGFALLAMLTLLLAGLLSGLLLMLVLAGLGLVRLVVFVDLVCHDKVPRCCDPNTWRQPLRNQTVPAHLFFAYP